MKVTSTKDIHFPQFNWGVNKNEVRELPEDKDAAKAILENTCISEAKDNGAQSAPKTDAPKADATSDEKKSETL